MLHVLSINLQKVFHLWVPETSSLTKKFSFPQVNESRYIGSREKEFGIWIETYMSSIAYLD